MSFNLEQNKNRHRFHFKTLPEPFLKMLEGSGISLHNENTVTNTDNFIMLESAEDIKTGQIVCLQKNNNEEDNGKCLVQDCNKEEDLDTLGIAVNDTVEGEQCIIQIRGIVDIDNSNVEEEKRYKVGTTLYCGEDGEAVTYINLSKIKNYVIIGKMTEPTKFLIDIKQYKMARSKKGH